MPLDLVSAAVQTHLAVYVPEQHRDQLPSRAKKQLVISNFPLGPLSQCFLSAFLLGPLSQRKDRLLGCRSSTLKKNRRWLLTQAIRMQDLIKLNFADF